MSRSTLHGAPTVDLFCGLGGGSIGAQQAGLNVILSAEIDEDIAKMYGANIPSLMVLSQDVRALSPIKAEPNALLIAGPPCQGHSSLNNHTRGNDPRNALYEWTIGWGIASDFDHMIIENVPNIIHSQSSPVDAAVRKLEQEGYSTWLRKMKATEVGVPQNRTRLFLVASKTATLGATRRIEPPTVAEALADCDDLTGVPRVSKANQARLDWLHAAPGRMRVSQASGLLPPSHQHAGRTHTDAYGRMDPNGYAPTLTTNHYSLGAGRFSHPTEPRMLSFREAARLQGIPDWYTFKGAKAMTVRKAIGNAIPPAMIREIIKSMK